MKMRESQFGPDKVIASLDLGSGWTRMVVSDVHEGSLRYRGHTTSESAGMSKGMIADLGPETLVIKRAKEQVDRIARTKIERCVIGVGGPHIRGLNTNGGIQLGKRMRAITREDVRNAMKRASSVEIPADRETLHLLIRQFILDNQPGIVDPVGMVCSQLEVDLHIATCSASALKSSLMCASRAGLEVAECVLEPIAAAECTLSVDERNLGVCVLDIGAHSSDLVVYFEDAVVHTGSVPLGGEHFTNDLAVGLQMTLAQAEKLKCEHGDAVVTRVPQHAEIEITGPQPQKLELRNIAEILEPRARELMHYVKDSLRLGGVAEALGAGCVLTGGGALLPGMLDMAEIHLRVPARIGKPVRISGMPEELDSPQYATVLGLLMFTHRTSIDKETESSRLRAKLRSIFA